MIQLVAHAAAATQALLLDPDGQQPGEAGQVIYIYEDPPQPRVCGFRKSSLLFILQ